MVKDKGSFQDQTQMTTMHIFHYRVNGKLTPSANLTLVGLFVNFGSIKRVKNVKTPFPIHEFKLDVPLSKYPL